MPMPTIAARSMSPRPDRAAVRSQCGLDRLAGSAGHLQPSRHSMFEGPLAEFAPFVIGQEHMMALARPVHAGVPSFLTPLVDEIAGRQNADNRDRVGTSQSIAL